VAWGDVSSGKPSPEPYLLAASHLGVDPTRCLVVEDSPAGVTAAVSAGAICVGVGQEGAVGPLLAAGAVVVVPGLRDLVVADDGAGMAIVCRGGGDQRRFPTRCTMRPRDAGPVVAGVDRNP